MSSGNTFNFGSINQTASGQGSVNQIGNNSATTTVNNGDRQLTVPEVFEAINQSLFEQPSDSARTDTLDDSAAVPSDSMIEADEETQEQILRPLQTMAELPAEELNKPERQEQVQSLLNRLTPYAPQIGKGLAVFGNAALTALASTNPVISGILAVCKMASAVSGSENQGHSV